MKDLGLWQLRQGLSQTGLSFKGESPLWIASSLPSGRNSAWFRGQYLTVNIPMLRKTFELGKY